MAYTPISQLKRGGGGYIPVVELTGKKPISEPVAFDLGMDIFGTQTTTPVVLSERTILPQDVLRVAGQGIARQWAATGAKIAQKTKLASDDKVDPKTFFGVSPNARALGKAIFGRDEPFNATSEDVEFLETFGIEKETTEKFGGSLTILLTALDFTGATPFKGVVGFVRAMKAADNLTDAAKAMRAVGFAEDVIESYGPAFVKAKTTKEVKNALDAATTFQSKTTSKGYRPVAELIKEGGEIAPRVVDDITPELKPLAQEARKFKNAEEFTQSILIEEKALGSNPITGQLQKEGFTLTDFYNQAVGGAREIVPETKVPPVRKLPTLVVSPTGRQLDELAKRVRELGGKSKEEITGQIGELSGLASIMREQIEEMPGKKLKPFISRKEGQFLDLRDPSSAKTTAERNRLLEREEKILRASESVFEGTPLSGQFDDPDVIRNAIEEYDKAKAQLETIESQIRPLRKSATIIRKGERAASIGMEQRRMQYRAVQGRYDLIDNEMRRFLHGRNISAMEEDEWRQFITEANKFGEQTEKHNQAMTQLQFTIQEKELKKWENLQAALNLPPVHKMNTEQLENFERILSQYKTGDEFLPVRMMQTLPNTELTGVKTTREVLEVLAKRSGKTIEEVEKIKATEWHRTLGDRRLARDNPFYEVLVERKNRGFVEANARIIELTDELDELIKKARTSRQRGLLERAVPTDENIIRWSETIDPEAKLLLEKQMTKEELTVAKRWDEIRKGYYDYLVKRHAEQKFSRFEGQYFPHVRRGFLEAWKEDGVLAAFKNMRDRYKQDAFVADILNEQTGKILPYEKWIGFAQFRSDKLIPTKNAAKAFEAYITALEKARHLDAMTPEIMAYVHTLSPRTFSQHGVELDTSLKKFVKEYINVNKGRVPKGFFNPGGTFDVGNRSLLALTRMVDLGWNFTTQLAAPIGENLMTLTMLKPQAYATAQARQFTKQGREILAKYKSFTGRSPWEEMTRASNDIGDKFMAGAFAIFGQSTKQANGLFLLGKMTDEEFKTGIISSQRLAKFQIEMSKYRHIRGMESILGRTTEAEAAKQYKSWAISPFTATIENAMELAQMIRRDGVAKGLGSDVGKELFYSVGIGSAIGLLTYTKYKELSEKGGKRSYMEDITYKAMRDAVTILGVFDPTMWSGVRVADFLEDVAKASYDFIFLEEYKTTGELKAPKEFKRILTPTFLRQLEKELLPEEEKIPQGGGSMNAVLKDLGLPPLPEIQKLPELPALPKL